MNQIKYFKQFHSRSFQLHCIIKRNPKQFPWANLKIGQKREKISFIKVKVISFKIIIQTITSLPSYQKLQEELQRKYMKIQVLILNLQNFLMLQFSYNFMLNFKIQTRFESRLVAICSYITL